MLAALQNVNSIMVRLPNWVGDIVMATPVFECLRANFPNATISACVRPYAREIVQDGPWFDHVIGCNDKSIAGIKQVVNDVSAHKPDMALLLPNSTHSFVTARLCGIKQIYGYQRNFRRHFLSGGPLPIREGKGYKPLPMQDYYLELCRHLELEIPEPARCKLYLSPSLEAEGEALLTHYEIKAEDTVIGLNPGASFGSSKCWPTEHFARLAELLQKKLECKVLLFVGPGEEEIAEKIIAESTAKITNTGPDKIDLAQLKPLVKRCNLLVSNDTGPRHYAVAFNIPTVVLMGPTNPLYTASNLDNTTVIRRELPCSPCHKKTCPIDHRCMTEITPAMVAQEVVALLEKYS